MANRYYEGQQLWVLETGERVTVKVAATDWLIVANRAGTRLAMLANEVTDDRANLRAAVRNVWLNQEWGLS